MRDRSERCREEKKRGGGQKLKKTERLGVENEASGADGETEVQTGRRYDGSY